MVFSNFFAKKKQTKKYEANDKRSKFQKKGGDQKRSKRKLGSIARQKQEGSNVSSKAEDNSKRTRPRKRQRTKPSEEALQLSEQLKNYSRQKNLEEALRVYNDPSNASLLDEHHMCIVVDCCGRCGDIKMGERIVKEFQQSGRSVNVETKTALIKGYGHSGQIIKAEALFQEMVDAKNRNDRPNVRTLNTLLRGCLWSAAYPDGNGSISGGVLTAEKAWEACRKLQDSDSKLVLFDISSYEYSIALLCQALRTNDASSRIEQMKSEFASGEKPKTFSQSVSEALALSLCALARAHAMLGEKAKTKDACQEALSFTQQSRKALEEPTHAKHSDGRLATKQGKDKNSGRREESNTLYRKHRLNEVEREINVIKELCAQDGLSSDARALARRLITRTIVVSGGGTTDLQAQVESAPALNKAESRKIQGQLLNTLFFSFGLREVLEKLGVSVASDQKALNKKDCNQILGAVGLQGGLVRDGGNLDLKRVFASGIGQEKGRKKQKGGLEIELGSGFGDWIVGKALQAPSTNFLSVELRADRVGQTFARTALLAGTTPVNNLCVVGAESGSFLSKYIVPESVSTIYINHPEPPTQTSGSRPLDLKAIMGGGDEAAHMISSTTVKAAAKCLKRQGKLVIVTDNRWYGRLICATVVKVMNESPTLLLPVELEDSFSIVEEFPGPSQIKLYEGQPNESIGHPPPKGSRNGNTYFDRLWRSGAGSHAEKSSRFIIVVRKG